MAAAAESLQARLELVLDERLGALTADQRGFLQVALKDGQRLLKLIADFQEIALADSGALELELTRVDLAEAVEQAIVPVWPRALALGKSIVVNAAHPVTVAADTQRLHTAVLRVVQQAVQHGAPGAGIEIEVGDGELRFVYEADTAPAQDSLALAHASAIAHAHGGALTISTDGTNVEIVLGLVSSEATLLPFFAAA